MNAPQPKEEPADFPGRTAAVCLGAALLLALFFVLLLAWRDHGRRSDLETTMEPTAVGDTHYFPAPVPPRAGSTYPAVAAFHGQPLYPADYRRHEYPADDMMRAGLTDAGAYLLYTPPVKEKNSDERKAGPVYYLKLSPTEYFKTRPGAGGSNQ
jgi:hypothetical protein